MSENVKIPLSLLSKTIELLECIDINAYDFAVTVDYENVLYELLKKKQSLALRQTYGKVVFAKTEDERINARLQYLQEKRTLKESFSR